MGLLVVPVDMPTYAGLSPADVWLPGVLLVIGYLLHTESTASHPAEPLSDQLSR